MGGDVDLRQPKKLLLVTEAACKAPSQRYFGVIRADRADGPTSSCRQGDRFRCTEEVTPESPQQEPKPTDVRLELPIALGRPGRESPRRDHVLVQAHQSRCWARTMVPQAGQAGLSPS